MQTANATVKMDENGRVTLPKAVRKKLGVDGREVYIDVEVKYEGEQ